MSLELKIKYLKLLEKENYDLKKQAEHKAIYDESMRDIMNELEEENNILRDRIEVLEKALSLACYDVNVGRSQKWLIENYLDEAKQQIEVRM